MKSAKLHAVRTIVPCMPGAVLTLTSYVSFVPRAVVYLVSCVFHAFVPHVLAPYLSSCLTCSRASRFFCSSCSRASLVMYHRCSSAPRATLTLSASRPVYSNASHGLYLSCLMHLMFSMFQLFESFPAWTMVTMICNFF